MRVLAWNVHSLRDDAAGVARVIREVAPDIALIQEAPRLWRWRSKCAALARESGLVVVTGGRSAAGNLLLCSMRMRVVSSYDVLLPKRARLHRRGAAVAVLELDGRQVRVLGTHVDLEPTARLGSALRLRDSTYDVIGADGLFVGPGLGAASGVVREPGPVSDHNPIVVDLEPMV